MSPGNIRQFLSQMARDIEEELQLDMHTRCGTCTQWGGSQGRWGSGFKNMWHRRMGGGSRACLERELGGSTCCASHAAAPLPPEPASHIPSLPPAAPPPITPPPARACLTYF